MAPPQSYKPMLKKWCNIIRPKRILEWGPGESTKLMRELCPDAEIISVEHQRKYYDIWSKHFENDPKTKIILKEADESDRTLPCWDEYTQPVDGKFDLIFVDGRERVRCLRYAKKVITKNGIVLLHDSERGYYKKGIELFEKLEEWGGTVCLRLP